MSPPLRIKIKGYYLPGSPLLILPYYYILCYCSAKGWAQT
jgi:hypothetical protein